MKKLDLIGDKLQKGQSLALGNFDGVHLGHQAVLAAAQNLGPLAVVSFDPHPRRFFAPDAPRFELMNTRTLERILRENGAQSVYQIRFEEHVADLPAEDFLNLLNDKLAPTAITTGEDFAFGKDRSGNIHSLKEWGERAGVRIQSVPKVEIDGEKVSSTRIRAALNAGDPREAARLLGRPHIINGIVTQGDQRGRDLGFPTANLYPKSVMLPHFGIYATRLRIHDGPQAGDYMGASSLGVRPSFGINQPNFETYILDFDADIYGREISVELIDYIRGEEKFDNLDTLIAQMSLDVEECRQILSGSPRA